MHDNFEVDLTLGLKIVIEWITPMDRAQLEKMSAADLRQIRENALNRKRFEVAELCDEILLNLYPTNKPKAKVITEYHFVCRRGVNLFEIENGLFKSGEWVVASDHCERSKRYGAIVALHETKTQLSYFQGRILDYERVFNDRTRRWRIQFTLDPTSEPLAWVGDGTGERGYRYE